MLRSVVFELSSLDTVPILGPLGRPIQGWFLEQVSTQDPALGKLLHDGSKPKPYTVSTLLDEHSHPLHAGYWLKEGEQCWIRITTLSSDLSQLVEDFCNKRLPKRLELYKMKFRMDGFTCKSSEHLLAGGITFPEITDEAGTWINNHPGKETDTVRLEFTSPTAFRNHEADVPLPIPKLLCHSWLKSWNTYAPAALEIAPMWLEFAENCFVVSELTNLNTSRWSFADGTHGVATGFTGTVALTRLPQHKCGEYAEIWAGANVILYWLSLYSFFCGTGHHTTIGLGQTRPIVPKL
jgi:CRISPR-associated endoribonuclease Cas6